MPVFCDSSSHALGWSVISDCGIPWPYSLTFWHNLNKLGKLGDTISKTQRDSGDKNSAHNYKYNLERTSDSSQCPVGRVRKNQRVKLAFSEY